MGAFNEFALAFPAFLVDDQLTEQGNDVSIAGGQTVNYTPTFRCPPGTVIVKESGDGLYYLADGADGVNAGDINTVALVSSAEAPDADWDSKVLTWTVYYPDGTVASGTVTAGGADDTVGEWVTLLNADASFRNHLIAAANTILEIRTLKKGNIRLRIAVNLTTAYGTISGSNSYTEASGAEADYRVITQHRDLKDINGTSMASKMVGTLLKGRFKTSELLHLSQEAKAVFLGRGASFE